MWQTLTREYFFFCGCTHSLEISFVDLNTDPDEGKHGQAHQNALNQKWNLVVTAEPDNKFIFFKYSWDLNIGLYFLLLRNYKGVEREWKEL